jgi:hypothetical protein
MPKNSNRRVHFATVTDQSGETSSSSDSMWKPDFVTTHMYQGCPDRLSRAEAAQVDAEISSDPERMCRELLSGAHELTMGQCFSS